MAMSNMQLADKQQTKPTWIANGWGHTSQTGPVPAVPTLSYHKLVCRDINTQHATDVEECQRDVQGFSLGLSA
jgi:hypothetical protein